METEEYRLIPIGEIVDEDSETSLNLFHLATIIWDGRKIILSLIVAFLIIGAFIYLIKPDTYSTSASLLPEINTNQSNNSLFRQFSGFFNMNGNGLGGQDNLSVTLYPTIVQSLPFELELIRQPVYFSSLDTTISIYTYYTKFAHPSFYTYLKHYTIGSSALDARMFVSARGRKRSDDTTIYKQILNKKYVLHTKGVRIGMANAASNLVDVSNNPDGTIGISAHMPDPAAAADLVSITTQLLTKYVTNYRVHKARNDEQFIQDQTDKAYQRYVNAQNALDKFNDANVNLATAQAKSEQSRLQAEYNLAFQLYQNLAQQLDQAKIKVQQQTPVFTTLEPAKIPSGKKDPGIIEIVAGSLFLGFFFGCGYLFLKQVYHIILLKWNSYRDGSQA